VARAQSASAEAPPDAEALRAAATEFELGDRAYAAREYSAAAVHFEAAFEQAPHPDTLELALRARLKTGDYAWATTLSRVAVDTYTAPPSLMALAERTLAEHAPSLGQWRVTCRPECSLALDGKLVRRKPQASVLIYVTGGPHTLAASWPAGRTLSADRSATRGKVEEFTFDAPPLPPSAPTSGTQPSTSKRPLPPWVFYTSAGVAAALGAGAIASYVDAVQNPGQDRVRAECIGLGEACPTYQQAEAAELRTNALIVAAVGTAVVSATLGLFFTDFAREPVRVGSTRLRPTCAPSQRHGGEVGQFPVPLCGASGWF
jgi:hypothetical protein